MSTATAKTTVVRPVDAALREALCLALAFAAIKLLLQIAANLWQAHLGYGYFRDEFYYIACGRHLAWGYVDHGPVVALQARVALGLFGRSLTGIRMLSAMAGAGRLFLTGILAWAMGGRRHAQALAMLGVLVAPMYLALDGYLSMNSFESLFWMGCLLAMILILRGGSPRLWLWFGVCGGIGLLNKPSMAFFLLALLVALFLSAERRLLQGRWAALGVALIILIALPNLLWQIHNHWPTLEFLRNGREQGKNVTLGVGAFLGTQLQNMHPLNVLIWGAGLWWLLRNRTWRWLGLTFCLFLAGMMALHAKDYYVAPIYPVLFAAGGIAWERRLAANSRRIRAFPVLQTSLVITAILISPMSLPLLRAPQWLAYTRALHLYGRGENSETESSGLLPQFYADRFGWQEEVDQVERIYRALSPEDRQRVRVFCSNYGEAGAIEFLGPGLPVAISTQNNYFLWGPRGATGEVIIAINGATLAEMRQRYASVEIAGRMDTRYAMPFEHRNIYLARGRKVNLQQEWPKLKFYF